MKIYEYDDCKIAEENNFGDCILASDFDFYKIPVEKKQEYLKGSTLLAVRNLNDNLGLLLLVTLTIIATIVMYMSKGIYVLADNQFLIATVFLLLNIPLHEAGHILFLKAFYPQSKIKAGFKFVFIYPAFYVDTSYSYFCPKYKRICVYMAGNFLNCLFLLIIYFLFPTYLKYCYVIVSNILVNFIPIIKSDGYYAMVTFFSKYNSSKSQKEEYMEDFVRGMIMFIFMTILSYIF